TAAKVAAARALHVELLGALEQLVAFRAPTARVTALLSEASHLEALATQFDAAAGERLRALVEGLGPVLMAEGSVSIDPRRTTAGLLQTQAADMRARADGLRTDAAALGQEIEQRRGAVLEV